MKNSINRKQLSTDQILEQIKHLPRKDKQFISQELGKQLGKELANQWLTDLFRKYSMKDLDLELTT